MESTDDAEAARERRCEVAGVHDYSVLLDPGSGRPRFLLPRRLMPGEVQVGDRVHVSTRHVPDRSRSDGDAGVGQIFDEARRALEGLESGWQRPGMPSDAAASA